MSLGDKVEIWELPNWSPSPGVNKNDMPEDYKELKWDRDSIMIRLKECQADGWSVDDIAKQFFPVPRSRTFIYWLWKQLFKESFKRIKLKRYCVVCGEVLRKGINATTKMHRRCRSAYFRQQNDKEKISETEKEFKEIFKKLLYEGVSK
jgi:hypothetical protein